MGNNLVIMTLPPGANVAKTIAALKARPGVRFVEPDYYVRINATPDDPRFGEQWHLNNRSDKDIDGPEAWDVQTGADGIRIAVVDTGVDAGSPDLAPNMYRNPNEVPGDGVDNDNNGFVDDIHGVDFITRTGNPVDDNGHGTHVASIAAAAGGNGTGITGVAQRAQIMALKFLNRNGSGLASDGVAAIRYATANGAHVINASWGGGGYSQALKEAIDEAAAQGIVVVCAAGNEATNSDRDPNYPSSYLSGNIISVGASTRSDRMATFSNYGARSVDVMAPGQSILGAFPGGSYGTLSGTSMAAPIVAGVVAMVKQRYPGENYAQTIQRVYRGAEKLPAFAGKCVTGGRVNLARALGAPTAAPGDDHPDDPKAGTTLIGINSSIAGRMDSRPVGRDNDWFRFYVSKPGRVDLFTTGSVNTYGYLCGSRERGFPVLREDNDAGAGGNFRIGHQLTRTGHYYIRVRGFGGDTGNYTLRVNFR